MTERIPLTDMKTGEMGTVAEIFGGGGVSNRLRAMGIRPGVKILKVSTAFARGPVVVRVGSAQTALGFGISYKIVVEINR